VAVVIGDRLFEKEAAADDGGCRLGTAWLTPAWRLPPVARRVCLPCCDDQAGHPSWRAAKERWLYEFSLVTVASQGSERLPRSSYSLLLRDPEPTLSTGLTSLRHLRRSGWLNYAVRGLRYHVTPRHRGTGEEVGVRNGTWRPSHGYPPNRIETNRSWRGPCVVDANRNERSDARVCGVSVIGVSGVSPARLPLDKRAVRGRLCLLRRCWRGLLLLEWRALHRMRQRCGLRKRRPVCCDHGRLRSLRIRPDGEPLRESMWVWRSSSSPSQLAGCVTTSLSLGSATCVGAGSSVGPQQLFGCGDSRSRPTGPRSPSAEGIAALADSSGCRRNSAAGFALADRRSWWLSKTHPNGGSRSPGRAALSLAGTLSWVARRRSSTVRGRRRLPASGTESRSSVTSSPDGIRRSTGSAATVPARTTTEPLCQ
jgi:hypothetical protein